MLKEILHGPTNEQKEEEGEKDFVVFYGDSHCKKKKTNVVSISQATQQSHSSESQTSDTQSLELIIISFKRYLISLKQVCILLEIYSSKINSSSNFKVVCKKTFTSKNIYSKTTILIQTIVMELANLITQHIFQTLGIQLFSQHISRLLILSKIYHHGLVTH